MKNIFSFLTLSFLVFNLYAQDGTTPVGDLPVLTFETETIDYGTIEQDADGAREFVFKNTGTTPLIINNCAGTCGCTVPNCPKEAILPGETGKIAVKYATNRLGQFNKGVKIYSNATPADQPITVYIKGNVLPKPGTGTEPAITPQGDPHAGHDH
ncbi:MAG: DUF1573 domain-containing protein [Chitinophagales bacterium]|nr:DUF1573 domain-containing protein [Chitinophagales bacterium]